MPFATLGLKEFCFRSGGGAFDTLVAHVRSVARRDDNDDVDTQGPPRPFQPFTRCRSNIRKSPVMYTYNLRNCTYELTTLDSNCTSETWSIILASW